MFIMFFCWFWESIRDVGHFMTNTLLNIVKNYQMCCSIMLFQTLTGYIISGHFLRQIAQKKIRCKTYKKKFRPKNCLVSFFLFRKWPFNPCSHCLFCVSRLTAIYHMRHPLKADLCKKRRRLWCLCVRPSTRTHPGKWFKTEGRRQIFTFFAITWL